MAADNRRERTLALLHRMAEENVDAMLLSSLPNIRYVTGFSGSNALVLVQHSAVTVITDFRYETQVAEEVADFARVRIEASNLWSAVWETLQNSASAETVGFESAHLVHRDFQRLLEQGARWQWRPLVNVVENLREVKDEGEVELIREAGAIATRALAAVLPQIAPGLTELQVAGILEKALRDEGSEEAPFPPIVASGPRAALPHARASRRRIQSGDLLLLDFGAQYVGYCSDITRTVSIGPASDEQREVHQIVREANRIASRGIRAGMSGQDADALARGYIDARGQGGAFGHGLGHGLGLEVHEAPRLARTAEGELRQGSVVTIEPGVYRKGWGGVRIEDDVHLSADGPRILTEFSRELLEVA